MKNRLHHCGCSECEERGAEIVRLEKLQAGDPAQQPANPQAIADYLYDETTKLDAPISYTACLVLAKHILGVAAAPWQPIETAPKDGTRILVLLKDPLPVEGRDDLERWHGVPFVARHWELPADGFDIGWQFAAPVGQGGFPDSWMVGWQPLSLPSAHHSPTEEVT